MNKNKTVLSPQNDEAEFYKQVADLLISARQHAKRQLDNTIAVTYYEMGRMIVEREQQGEKRARYGAKLIKSLSEYLTESIGKGFSVANLKNIRKFYQIYAASRRTRPMKLKFKTQDLQTDKTRQISALAVTIFVVLGAWRCYTG